MALTWHDKACLHFITLLPARVLPSGVKFILCLIFINDPHCPGLLFPPNSPVSLQGIVPESKIIIITMITTTTIIITQPLPHDHKHTTTSLSLSCYCEPHVPMEWHADAWHMFLSAMSLTWASRYGLFIQLSLLGCFFSMMLHVNFHTDAPYWGCFSIFK